MSDRPEGAFVPKHGRGWLLPVRPFQKGNQAAKGNKAHADFRKPKPRQAAYALRSRFPALAEAMAAPATTQRAWWRKRQAKLLRDLNGNQAATERYLIGMIMLRMHHERKPHTDNSCQQCGQPFGGEVPLPVIAGALVSAWVHPRCLASAMQAIVMKARLALAQALTPHK